MPVESERLPAEIEALLRSSDWEEREAGLRRAGRWVRTVPTPGLRAQLAELLPDLVRDPKWEVRAGVARLLQDFEPVEFDELVQRLREDQDAQVIRLAEQALRKWRRVAREQVRRERQWERWATHETEAAPEWLGSVRTAVRELAQGVSHDLRREAQALGHVANTLRATRHTKAQERLFGRLDLVYEQLMEFAKDIETYANETPQSFERESIVDVAELALDIAYAGRAPQAELLVEISRELWAEVPKGGLARALGNLIRNALEAIEGEEGRVEVRAHQEDETIVLVVEDNGRGMHPSEVRALFAPLASTKKGSTTEVHTGMGLAIAERVIVEDCGGVLEVTKTGEGAGTTIVARLPVRQEH